MAGWRSMFSGLGGPLGVPSSGANSNPGTGPNGINAGQLEPNSRAGNMAAGVPYQLVPCYPPFIRIANDRQIIYQPRFRTLVFGGSGVVAATTVDQWQFSVPTIIIARTGAAFLPVGTAFDVGRNPLDSALVQFYRVGAGQDLLDSGGQNSPSTLTAGSAILGDGKLPAFIPGTGMFVDTGGYINVQCQTLINSVTYHVTIFCVEEWGPSRG